MHRSFVIPSRFHAGYSPAGRLLRVRSNDPRRAETLFIVLAALVGLAVLLFQILSWNILGPSIGLAAGHAILLVLFVALFVAGRQPEAVIQFTGEALTVRSPGERVRVPIDRIRRVTTIDPQRFHRHYRRYRQTRYFVHRIHPELLLLETDTGPVILGLPPSESTELRALLLEDPTASRVDVA